MYTPFQKSAIFYSRKTGYYPSLFYNVRYCKFNEARDKSSSRFILWLNLGRLNIDSVTLGDLVAFVE